jgi:hypothetical protein
LSCLGYRIKSEASADNSFHFDILIADELVHSIGLLDAIQLEHHRLTGPPDRSLDYVVSAVAAALRPVSSFRVTYNDQVWPPQHAAQLAAFKEAELIRAEAIMQGTPTTPALNPVVFDSSFMHPETRDIVWDLRAYWAAREKSVDDPSLIVPLYSVTPPPSKINHDGLHRLTNGPSNVFPDTQTVFDLAWGVDNQATPAKHAFCCSNWPKIYQYFDISATDIQMYEDKGWIEFASTLGLSFTHCSIVAQNSVVKPGKDPEKIRRRVIDHTAPRTAVTAENGQIYSLLSLNSRSDIRMQAEVQFSSFERLEAKAMSLSRSQLPVVTTKADGDAWYKQFTRRLHQVAEGLASWPTKDKAGHCAILRLFHDFTVLISLVTPWHHTARIESRI